MGCNSSDLDPNEAESNSSFDVLLVQCNLIGSYWDSMHFDFATEETDTEHYKHIALLSSQMGNKFKSIYNILYIVKPEKYTTYFNRSFPNSLQNIMAKISLLEDVLKEITIIYQNWDPNKSTVTMDEFLNDKAHISNSSDDYEKFKTNLNELQRIFKEEGKPENAAEYIDKMTECIENNTHAFKEYKDLIII